MSDTLSLQARIAATPSKVFHALTDETAVTTWLAEHAAISLPEQHYGFWGDTTPQGDQTHQTLLSAEPDRLLRFSWTLDGTPTTVEIELQPDGSQTVLRLRQDGLPTLDELMAPTGRRDGLHSMHTFWGLALANLAEYTEGRPLTPKADFRPKRAPEIRVRMEIDATPHEVFESLIDPTQIARWFGWEVESNHAWAERSPSEPRARYSSSNPTRPWPTPTTRDRSPDGNSKARAARPSSRSCRAATPMTSGTTPPSMKPGGSAVSPNSSACMNSETPGLRSPPNSPPTTSHRAIQSDGRTIDQNRREPPIKAELPLRHCAAQPFSRWSQ